MTFGRLIFFLQVFTQLAAADVSLEECRTFLLYDRTPPETCGCFGLSDNADQHFNKSLELCETKEKNITLKEFCCVWANMNKEMTLVEKGKPNKAALDEFLSPPGDPKNGAHIEECENFANEQPPKLICDPITDVALKSIICASSLNVARCEAFKPSDICDAFKAKADNCIKNFFHATSGSTR